MSKAKRSKKSCVTLQEIEIIDDPASEPYDEENYTIQDPLIVSSPKKIKFHHSTSPQGVTQNVILNEKIRLTAGAKTLNMKLDQKTPESLSSSRVITKDDFFLKNENNCFYKCIHCSQTIKSKPSYKNHLRMVHKIDMNKYHTQRGFIDATSEFCTEFIQTDFNIVQTLTSIFDQIENVDRLVRDHQKRFRLTENDDHEEIISFLESEKIVLKFHGEMIERAFDIITEKKDLIFGLQEDVAELLGDTVDTNSREPQTVTEELVENGLIKDDIEDEPQYELYYVVEDIKQDKDVDSAVEIVEAEKQITENTSKRGRPKGISARSLDDCLTQLPKETAEYIRTSTINKASKYQCKMCDVTSKTKMLLCIHYMRVHFKIKNKICQYCDRAFASQGDLTRHIRIHSGEHPFKCDHPNCTSEFKTSGDLKKHKFVHERDPSHRQFQCEECKSKFARQTDYTRHKKIHLIAKNEHVGFTCELCKKVFYRKDLFNAHLNNHLQIKPFECETCLRRFAKKYDLLKHIQKQHLQVDCDYCGGQFESKSKLREHFCNGLCNGIVLS